jgi:hypothetical protein
MCFFSKGIAWMARQPRALQEAGEILFLKRRYLKIDKTVVIFDFFAVGAKQVWSFFFIFAADY